MENFRTIHVNLGIRQACSPTMQKLHLYCAFLNLLRIVFLRQRSIVIKTSTSLRLVSPKQIIGTLLSSIIFAIFVDEGIKYLRRIRWEMYELWVIDLDLCLLRSCPPHFSKKFTGKFITKPVLTHAGAIAAMSLWDGLGRLLGWSKQFVDAWNSVWDHVPIFSKVVIWWDYIKRVISSASAGLVWKSCVYIL